VVTARGRGCTETHVESKRRVSTSCGECKGQQAYWGDQVNLGAIFGSSFVLGLSGAMMPGSLLVVNINETSRRGIVGGVLAVTGHAVLELLVVAGFAFGLGGVLAHERVAGGIGLVGSAVLAWMAYGIIRSAWRGDVSLETTGSDAQNHLGPLAAGSLATVSNPYWMLWWASIGAAYAALALGRGPAALWAFYVGHISSDFAWYLLVSLVIITGKKFISDRLYRGLLLSCGVFLAGLAVYFVWTGTTMVLG